MSDVTTIVNAVLDRVRREQGLTEEALARELGVEMSTIWRWRNGRNLSKSTRILIPLITKSEPSESVV